MQDFTPKQIVNELDRHIIGQQDAKKAVAIALRNRWRRQNVEPEELRDEIVPKNILMIGSTGVGKTEISRRLAKLANAPFVKVEATKFTEVGYVGRDVESIIRDLIEVAITIVKERQHNELIPKAQLSTENRIVNSLVGEASSEETKQKFRERLRNGELEDKEIEIEVLDQATNNPMFDIPGMPGGQMGIMNLGDILGKGFGDKTKRRKITVAEAREIVLKEETDKLMDHEDVNQQAIALAENHGIVFIDEIDKIANNNDARGGQVSREGVQRDLLPLIEGTIVSTKHGNIKTDHILFIASGAFHLAKPADLLPELQGRLPIRVELQSLTNEDMIKILKEPESSLIKQYVALMKTEGIDINYTDDGIERIAQISTDANKEVENIGARRLHTIMEKLMEEISFEASDKGGQQITIDAKYVDKHLSQIIDKADLSDFIL